jgi:hypothetical protein
VAVALGSGPCERTLAMLLAAAPKRCIAAFIPDKAMALTGLMTQDHAGRPQTGPWPARLNFNEIFAHAGRMR